MATPEEVATDRAPALAHVIDELPKPFAVVQARIRVRFPPEPLVAFCEREHPRLVGALTLYTGDADLARDLAQEALARACQHWGRVGGMDKPGAWAQRVAFNLAHRAFGRRGDRQLRAQAHTQRVHEVDVGDAVAVRSAVAALAHRQRQAVILRFFLDLSVAETAVVMRCRVGTVKALTHQALDRLRVALGDPMEVPDDQPA